MFIEQISGLTHLYKYCIAYFDQSSSPNQSPGYRNTLLKSSFKTVALTKFEI